MRVAIDHIADEAPNISTFYFRPEKPVQYKPGQFVQLTLNHRRPDNRGTKRWFTLSSSPSDELISITTKFVPTNGSSFTEALRRRKVGDELEIDEPRGTFLLPKNVATPLIFVAGGIGITPFRSMLRWLETAGERRPIKLLYAVNSETEIIFRPTLETLGQDLTIIADHPSDSWTGMRGRLTPELILGVEKPSKETMIYISGPYGMVDSIETGLRERGIEKQQLVLDAFLGYPDFS